MTDVNPDALAALIGDLEQAESRAERNRLAWKSAARRATGRKRHIGKLAGIAAARALAVDEVTKERDEARTALADEQAAHDMTASSFEIFIESMREQAQAAESIANGLRARVAGLEESAERHAIRHRDIFDAHLRQVAELTDERDAATRLLIDMSGDVERAKTELAETRGEVVRLGKTVEAATKAHDELLRREVDHSGHGRDGHLNVDDLKLLFDALFPKWGGEG